MPIAFKEWAVTVRALAEGEQLLTLRKGGIREEHKHFELEHDRFFLYPTFDHQRNDVVRDSHQPELRRALEEGVWPDGEPPPHALTRDGGIPQPDRVRIRAWAEVAGHFTITDPRAVDALSPYYVWTTDYAREAARLEAPPPAARRAAAHLPHPAARHRASVRDDFQRLQSWLEITRDLPFEGTPVLSDDEFDRVREEIESICDDARARAGLSATRPSPPPSGSLARRRARPRASASAAAATSPARSPPPRRRERARHARASSAA